MILWADGMESVKKPPDYFFRDMTISRGHDP